MKLKCLVIDDDPLICDLIKHFCDKIPEIEYCISAGTGMDGLQVLSGQEINLIFLDFNLPDMKGQYLLEIKKTDVPVIMVTSEADFAAKSYEYEDVQDFLVKPISFDRFQKAVQRILTKPQRSTPVKQDQEVIFVKDGTKFVRIPYQDILYLKSEGNYVSFVTTDKPFSVWSPSKNSKKNCPRILCGFTDPTLSIWSGWKASPLKKLALENIIFPSAKNIVRI
ncbi:MAG: response regulator transcription factor [Saprospiraceae bacterium]|nr:response regulator transcription factor [Candidatus Vicinibacter affinis]